MEQIKTLAHIALAGALAFGSLSCDSSKQEVYQLDGEQVVLYSSPSKHLNILTVNRVDGTRIEYVDNIGYDLKLECIVIYDKNKGLHKYCNDAFGHKVVEEGQKQFDDYLAKIQALGLKDIVVPEKPKAEKE